MKTLEKQRKTAANTQNTKEVPWLGTDQGKTKHKGVED